MVANTIGAGVYTTSGFTLESLGSREAVLAVWFLAALLAAAGAVSFGALSKALPKSGGEYLYLSRLMHPAAGFIAGWVSLIAAFAGAEAYAAITFTEYIDYSPRVEMTIAIGLLLSLTLLQGYLVRMGTMLQDLTVLAKSLFLLLFGLLGAALLKVPAAPAALPAHTLWAWPVNLMWVSLSFTGFNSAIYVAEECENPNRDITRALLVGTAITAALYLLVNAVFLYSAPIQDLAGHPDIALRSAMALGGPALRRAVQWLVLLSLFTLISGMAVAGPRVAVKMGEDGFLPPLSLKQAALFQGGLAILMTLQASLRDQLSYLSLSLSLTSALAVACVFRIDPKYRPHPLFPVVYLVGTALSALASVSVTPKAANYTVLTVVSGAVIYYLLERFRPPSVKPGSPEAGQNQDRE